MKTLANSHDRTEVLRRLQLVRPDSTRQWGRMTAHQMICHLRDAFLIGTDPALTSQARGLQHRTVIKWIALYVPVRWPRGLIATRPEIDQVAGGGVRPADFAADVGELAAAVETLTADPAAFFRGRRHPIFGQMSQTAWLRWAYLHVDHHLRQFGV